MLLAAWSGPLSTLFAAIAALGALGAIWQARRLHAEDRADRARERDERRREFETERDESRRVLAEQRRLQQLEQLERVSELVASVRKTARGEATGTDGRIAADRTSAPFFWNARKQLELGINIFEALGGPALPACRDLATSSAMGFLGQVVGGATSAFDERAATVARIEPEPSEYWSSAYLSAART